MPGEGGQEEGKQKGGTRRGGRCGGGGLGQARPENRALYIYIYISRSTHQLTREQRGGRARRRWHWWGSGHEFLSLPPSLAPKIEQGHAEGVERGRLHRVGALGKRVPGEDSGISRLLE